MIDLATVDAASAMVVATTCSGVACGIIGYIVGSVRQSAYDSAVMDSLRKRLREKPKCIKQDQGFNGDLITDNQWMRETANESSGTTKA